jgi:hypothetical protein
MPGDDPREVYDLCISKVRDRELKKRLESAGPIVESSAAGYVHAGSTVGLHTVPTTTGVGALSVSDMTKVYTQRMVPRDSPGRPVYDRIMGIPDYGRCPFCGQRTVTTLDHYLPKADYSALVVTPANLVPCCSECNKAKSDGAPKCQEELFFHPYFEDFDDERWLQAQLVEESPPALEFVCTPPTSWSPTKSARVAYHFGGLGLARLYGAHSGAELVNLRGALRRVHAAAGTDGVRQHLLVTAEGYREAGTNSWQTAMYSALHTSDWYCDGGFDSWG